MYLFMFCLVHFKTKMHNQTSNQTNQKLKQHSAQQKEKRKQTTSIQTIPTIIPMSSKFFIVFRIALLNLMIFSPTSNWK